MYKQGQAIGYSNILMPGMVLMRKADLILVREAAWIQLNVGDSLSKQAELMSGGKAERPHSP